MKKSLLLFAGLFVTCFVLNAEPVGEKNILKAAKNFFSKNARLRSDEVGDVKILLTSRDQEREYYHVVQEENTGIWVILSGDDEVDPVLAYSQTPNWGEDINPTFQIYLDGFQSAIKDIVTGKSARLRSSGQGSSKEKWRNLLEEGGLRSSTFYSATPVVDILLKTEGKEITWSQSKLFTSGSYLYNQYCPQLESESKALTGCVATAMGMLIKYWGDQTAGKKIYGKGRNSYKHDKYGILSADFQGVAYDVANMPAYLSDREGKFTVSGQNYTLTKSTDTQNQEVARLLYHCGVAVNMVYDTGFSGAYNAYMPGALASFFGFDKSYVIEKKSYSDTDWKSLLKAELNARRPVIYSGISSSGGGHAFIIDGYDSDNYFHVNWGWGPFGANAFLNLDLTTYTEEQEAIIQLQPCRDNYVQVLDFNITGKGPDGINIGDFVSVHSSTDTENNVDLVLYNPTDRTISFDLTLQIKADASNYYIFNYPPTIELAPKELKTLNKSIVLYYEDCPEYIPGNILWSHLVFKTDLGSGAGTIETIQTIDHISILENKPTSVSINRQPVSQVVKAGRPAVIKVYAQGNNPQYQWYKDGIMLPGKTSNSLLIESARQSDAGKYKCIVRNADFSQITSSEAELTVMGELDKDGYWDYVLRSGGTFDWNQAASWINGNVPDSSDSSVLISGGSKVIINKTDVIQVNNLKVVGTLENNGTLNVNGKTIVGF